MVDLAPNTFISMVGYDPKRGRVSPGATALVYDVLDAERANPLPLTDNNGAAMALLTAGPDGVYPEFIVATEYEVAEVNIVSGPYVTRCVSRRGSSGEPGADGREVEFRSTSTSLQWRYSGDATWTTLIPRADIMGPPGGLQLETWDDSPGTFKLILQDGGVLQAVPASATRPLPPVGLVTEVRLAFIRVTWTPPAGATRYWVYRNGSYVGQAEDAAYIDDDFAIGGSYTYQVRAANQYNMLGEMSLGVTAQPTAGMNVAPDILDITVWPSNPGPGERVYVRLNSTDFDSQELVNVLTAGGGTLTPTYDPTKWIWTP